MFSGQSQPGEPPVSSAWFEWPQLLSLYDADPLIGTKAKRGLRDPLLE